MVANRLMANASLKQLTINFCNHKYNTQNMIKHNQSLQISKSSFTY